MTTQTQTVAEFLLARIAEDEAWLPPLVDECEIVGGRFIDGRARVLADCAAKRRIVELHAEQTAERRVAQARADIDDLVLGHIEGQEIGLAWAVTALASAYADHPDYRDEWRA